MDKLQPMKKGTTKISVPMNSVKAYEKDGWEKNGQAYTPKPSAKKKAAKPAAK
jgi:hypothetical protein